MHARIVIHHIGFFREYAITDALQGQPLDGKFDTLFFPLSEVILGSVYAFRESKVRHFDHEVIVNPAD